MPHLPPHHNPPGPPHEWRNPFPGDEELQSLKLLFNDDESVKSAYNILKYRAPQEISLLATIMLRHIVLISKINGDAASKNQ